MARQNAHLLRMHSHVPTDFFFLSGKGVAKAAHLFSTPGPFHEFRDAHASSGLPLHGHRRGLQERRARRAATVLPPRSRDLGDVVPLARDGEVLLSKTLQHLRVDVPAHPVLGSLLVHRVLRNDSL